MAPTPWQHPLDGTPDKVKYICFVRQYCYVVFLFELGMGMDIQFFFGMFFGGSDPCRPSVLFSKGTLFDRKLLAHRMIRPDQPPKQPESEL